MQHEGQFAYCRASSLRCFYSQFLQSSSAGVGLLHQLHHFDTNANPCTKLCQRKKKLIEIALRFARTASDCVLRQWLRTTSRFVLRKECSHSHLANRTTAPTVHCHFHASGKWPAGTWPLPSVVAAVRMARTAVFRVYKSWPSSVALHS